MNHVTELSRMVSGSSLSGAESEENATFPEWFRPEIILYPETVGEISEILKFSSQNGVRVVPFSGGTKLFLRGPEPVAFAALSLGRMNRMPYHEPSDMVCTVECGMKVRDFREAVRARNQIFPADPPFLDSGATVGGLVSTNLCGPSSTRYATCRELILGARAVRADGEIISVGGKVVKNVAGYDIAKLLTGSFGTLCVVAEATFRLYPRQPSSKTVLLGFDDPTSCSRTARKLLDADIVPACFDILDESLSAEFRTGAGTSRTILLRFDSLERAVGEQTDRARKTAEAEGATFVKADEELAAAAWEFAREFPFDREASFLSRAALPVSDSIELMENLAENPETSEAEISCLARPARGIVLVSAKGRPEASARAARYLESLARRLSGGIMFAGLCPELEGAVSPWSGFGESFPLMKSLKLRFDPAGALPGEGVFGPEIAERP